MHCIVCFSEEFREDENGFYFCIHCGTQTQDYFAESFETDEAPTGPIRTRRIKVHIGIMYVWRLINYFAI